MVTVFIAIDPDSRVSLYVGAGWAVCLAIGWALLKRRGDAAPAVAAEQLEPVGGPGH